MSISVNSPKRLSLYKDLIGLTDYLFVNFWAMLIFVFLKVLNMAIYPALPAGILPYFKRFWGTLENHQKLAKNEEKLCQGINGMDASEFDL